MLRPYCSSLGRKNKGSSPKAAPWGPSSLFSGGEDGLVFMASDSYSDTSLTIPASVDGVVAGLKDRSPNVHNATQGTSTLQPILQETNGLRYIKFDGSADQLSCGNILSFGINSFSISFAIDRVPSIIEDIISRRGSGGAGSNPGWGIRIQNDAVVLEADDGSTNSPTTFLSGATLASGVQVITVIIDRTAKIATAYVNSVSEVARNLSTIGDVTGTQNLTIGAPVGSYYIQSSFYGAVILDRIFTAAEQLRVEQWLAGKAGVTL